QLMPSGCSSTVSSVRGTVASVEPEDTPGVEQPVDQAIDLLGRRVDPEARSGGRDDPEPVHQRLGAVVAGADGDAVAVEDLGDVVGVDAGKLERDRTEPGGGGRRAERSKVRDIREAL